MTKPVPLAADPAYRPVSTYLRRTLYLRLKVYCAIRELPLHNVEEAIESWLKLVKAR